MPAFARGHLAWGLCQRCGIRYLLRELVLDGYYPNIRVCTGCYDPPQPQERLAVVSDPVALWKPAPDAYAVNPPFLTAVASGGASTTLLLLHLDGLNGSGNPIDSSGNNVPLTLGTNGFLSTFNPKFGAESFYALNNDNAMEYGVATASYASGSALDIFATPAWTIEFQAQLASDTGAGEGLSCVLYGAGNSLLGGLNIEVATNGVTVTNNAFRGFQNAVMTGAASIPVSTWHHVALVLNAGVLTLYLDGVSVATNSTWYASGYTYPNSPYIFICPASQAGSTTDGNVDEVRVSSNAVYTANFTPPTQAFTPATGAPTVVLNWTSIGGPPVGEDKVGGMSAELSAGYQVYRSTDGVNFTQIASFMNTADEFGALSIETLTYTDTSPPANTVYYYVRGYDVLENAEYG